MFSLAVSTLVLFALGGQAAPTPSPLGIQFDKRGSLPQVAFPDAVYQASSYDLLSDIYTFKNIRFAAPPVGDLRWAKPAPPPKNSVVQTGSYGNACPQTAPNGLNFFGAGSDLPVGTAVDELLNKLAAPVLSGGAEDCLFLDLYVPGSAIRSPSTSKLSVIHWFYGGGYVLGSKDQLEPALPFYDGSGLVTESGNNVIFVASNYRLGAFGFLAGSTMEKTGLPNAGLYDQIAALQWTQDNIALVGGDPSSVTAMGESAGASSLLHHLTLNGGTTDPLFKRAILMSPAFEPIFDRTGHLEQVYQNFSSLAGCGGGDIACLRSQPSQTLISANQALNLEAEPGTFIVGPSPDGSLIRQPPALELASGNYWKGLDSLLVSHVSDESTLFVNGQVANDAELNTFIKDLFPAYALADGLDAAVEAQYPPVSAPGSPYATEGDRVRALIRDSSFTCNTRYLAEAYADRTYAMQYSVTPGWHATDLLAAFWSEGLASSALGDALEVALPFFSGFATGYKSYFTSFARSGNPNTYRNPLSLPWTVDWPLVHTNAAGEQFSNVLNAGDLGFGLVSDSTNEKSACQFWIELQAGITNAGGYAPPGSVVPSSLVNSSIASASSNYYT